MKVNVIIPCGGSGSRSGLNYNKLLAPLLGEPMIMRTLTHFLSNEDISRVILPCSSVDMESFCKIIRRIGDDRLVVTPGGDSRAASVHNATASVEKDCDILLIHDGARPFVSDSLIRRVISSAAEFGSAVAAVPLTDTLCHCDSSGSITSYTDRSHCHRVQTPQGFRAEQIISAYHCANTDNRLAEFTDDSSLMTAYGYSPQVVSGDEDNIKITFSSDFHRFIGSGYRIGCGYDTHQLVHGRPLIIGGLRLDYPKGLLGHSDADVLMHAIMDALLSAAGLRDIGVLFPDTSGEFKDIDSGILLAKVAKMLIECQLEVVNISAVIMAEKPKLARHIPLMAENIAKVLSISADKINISATTTEGLGLVGREEGIATSCIALCRVYS